MVFLVHFLLKSWLKTQHSKTNIMASSSITWWQIDGKKCKQRFYFLGLQNHCRWWLQTQKDNWLLGIKTMTNLDSILKSRGITLSTKVCIVIAMGFSISHIWMWELDHKESWAPKNWCFWNVVLEKTPESPVDSREIKPVNLKGNQPWTLIGRTDAEAPILWPPDAKSQLIGKDPDTGKDWGQK